MTMRNILVALIIVLGIIGSCQSQKAYKNAIFYCGFSGDFCGQSKINDVHNSINTVVLAFANTLPDGQIVVDSDINFPKGPMDEWKRAGKSIIISVGGQNGNWAYVFASQNSINNFINSIVKVIEKYNLDGVDLDIQAYHASPRTVANMIIQLKKAMNKLGRKQLIVSPEDVAVYQGAPVPNPDVGGQPFNYFVPIIQIADSSIDFYQVQAYNNWYDGLAGGSLDYFRDVYLNWRNLQGLSPWAKPLPNFSGVSPQKLRIGLLASERAGSAAYYGQPGTILQLKQYLRVNNYDLNGFMIWDSHWDALNNNAISIACSSAKSPGIDIFKRIINKKASKKQLKDI